MDKYYDIHNHLFNKDFLAKELLYRLMKELKHFLFTEDESERGIRDFVGGLKNVISILKRYSYAISVFCEKDSTAVYEELNKTYKGEFILTPLVFDLTYCFAPSPERAIGRQQAPSVKEVFENEMSLMFDMVEQGTRSLSRDFNASASHEDDKLWKEYLKEKERFMKSAAELESQHDKNFKKQQDRGLINLPDEFDGFDEQINQLRELKNNPKYKDMVFPFLAVDPRREGIAGEAKINVGKGKLFIGIKLYCPNGYSPTDPLLYGKDGNKDGIYAFCEENGIPVTAHNSDGGFATLSKSVRITGDIQYKGELRKMDNELLTFKYPFLNKDAVNERAMTLNHPLIWEKVVEKYPNLILNLAHFGGGTQLGKALDNPGDQTLWSNKIISLIKDSRYTVYTDVSCFSDFDVIKKLLNSPVYSEIKNKILYGSDFILLLLFENNFSKNVQQFKHLFGSDFDIIAGTNPREFLKNVI
jgi:predicted TIM-barrel fold metal-dependent hydrolase